MADQKISDLAQATELAGTEFGEIIQSGVNKKIAPDLLNPSRGDFVGTTAFPSTGGRFTGGAPMRGDRWRVITNPVIVGGSVFGVGSVVEAATNGAGATTLTDWIIYAVQS